MKKKINKSTTITLAICLVAIGVALYFFVFRKKSSSQTSTTKLPSASGSTTTPSTPSAKYTDDSFPLQLNSGGAKVKYLQLFLNNEYGAGLVVDGKFGPKTEAACKKNFKTPVVAESLYNTFI